MNLLIKKKMNNTARKTNKQNYTIMDTKYQNRLHKRLIIATTLVLITAVSLANLHKPTRGSCLLLCNVTLAGGVRQDSRESHSLPPPPTPPLPLPLS